MLRIAAIITLLGCDETSYREATAADAARPGIVVGELAADGAFVPYEDGSTATLVWGTQGAIMLRPTIRLGPAFPPAPFYTVTLDHAPDPAHSHAFPVEDAFVTQRHAIAPRERDGTLEYTSLFDPVSEHGAHEGWLRLFVTVEGDGLRAEQEVTLHLFEPTFEAACERYEVRTQPPCRFRRIPGEARITTIGDPSAGSIEIGYEMSFDRDALACEPRLGRALAPALIPAICVERAGLREGMTFAIVREVGDDQCGVHDDWSSISCR